MTLSWDILESKEKLVNWKVRVLPIAENKQNTDPVPSLVVMLDRKGRLLISSQFVNEDYCRNELELKAKCDGPAFTFFTSRGSENTNNCGDYIAFAVKKGKKGIEEVFFSRQEACIIAVSATNILCKWIIEKKKNFVETATLLSNLRKMINGSEYELADCQEMGVFSSLQSFTARKWCLLLVIDSFSRIIAE